MKSQKLTSIFSPQIYRYLIITIYVYSLLPLITCDETTNDNEYYYEDLSYEPNKSQRSFLQRILPKTGNSPSIDPDTVYNGIVDPNNIAIHVGQWPVTVGPGARPRYATYNELVVQMARGSTVLISTEIGFT